MMNARMREVWVAVHRTRADSSIENLQSLGLMHLSRAPIESIPPAERFEELEKLDYILKFPYFEKEKKDIVENFASLSRKLEPVDFEELAKQGIASIGVYGELKELEAKIGDAEKRMQSHLSLAQEIRYLGFTSEVPLHKLGETRSARLFLSKKPPEHTECEQVGRELYLCTVLKGQPLPPNHLHLNLLGLEGTPKEITAKALAQAKALEKERLALIRQARTHQVLLKPFKAAYDSLCSKKAKSEAMRNSASTANTVVLHGWVKAVDEKKLSSLEDCEFESRDPQGDNAPTAFANPAFLQPFETVTKVFGVPRYTEVDPTPYLAGFFAISMALCLTDAGYGLMLAIIASVLYLKYGLRFGMLLLYAGLLAIVVGALIGGWWGNLGEYVPLFKPILYPKGITPADFLVLSLSIGIIQITFSQLIAAREKLRAGNIVSALLDHLPWVVFLLAVCSIALDMAGAISFKYGLYIAGGCVLLVIITRGRNEKSLLGKISAGVFSPYDLVAYMGDILSFSRLLALGLTSGLIATSINLLAVLSLGIPIIGILLAPVILICGHVFNLFLSTLSAYIHSSRLQYVEFFNRFYSGGGFVFQPFSKGYKYFKEV